MFSKVFHSQISSPLESTSINLSPCQGTGNVEKSSSHSSPSSIFQGKEEENSEPLDMSVCGEFLDEEEN